MPDNIRRVILRKRPVNEPLINKKSLRGAEEGHRTIYPHVIEPIDDFMVCYSPVGYNGSGNRRHMYVHGIVVSEKYVTPSGTSAVDVMPVKKHAVQIQIAVRIRKSGDVRFYV